MSTLFRNKKNKKLYIIEYVSPPKYTGSWYEAKPWRHQSKTIKLRTPEEIDKKFEKVSYF